MEKSIKFLAISIIIGCFIVSLTMIFINAQNKDIGRYQICGADNDAYTVIDTVTGKYSSIFEYDFHKSIRTFQRSNPIK